MYIRTKDGVYEVVKFDEECIIPSPLIKVKNEYDKERITHCCKADIINQSENLEELCDCFVLMERDAKPIIFKTLQGAINNKIYDDEIIYGAIYTDKGLIYVSKMNDKGELELI